MSRCEGCDPPVEERKEEFCPDCGANLGDPHKPGCLAGWMDVLARDHPDIFAWAIRRRGGIPAEDIETRGSIRGCGPLPSPHVDLVDVAGQTHNIFWVAGRRVVVLKEREEI